MMDEARQPPMAIRIVLPEDSNATRPTRSLTIRHCGETIDGNLEVTITSESVFEIDVSFEGC